MPVFISYSHNDNEFVANLAAHLVKHNTRVWVDTWQLRVGDSIIEKIQEALQESSALLVILSKSSVQSNWCKKEINAGLMRELEEKKVIVLPVLLEDCDVPLFLKEKMYADFRSNFDNGLSDILEGIAKVTNASQSRIEYPNFHVDWSVDWGFTEEDTLNLKFILVEQAHDAPFTVLTELVIACNESATKRYRQYKNAGVGWYGRYLITERLEFIPNKENYKILLEDQHPVIKNIMMQDSKSNKEDRITITCRRLGEDTGKDILVDLGKCINDIRKYMKETGRELTDKEKMAVRSIVLN